MPCAVTGDVGCATDISGAGARGWRAPARRVGAGPGSGVRGPGPDLARGSVESGAEGGRDEPGTQGFYCDVAHKYIH